MPRYVVERNFGGISDDDMLAAAALSGELIEERFQGARRAWSCHVTEHRRA